MADAAAPGWSKSTWAFIVIVACVAVGGAIAAAVLLTAQQKPKITAMFIDKAAPRTGATYTNGATLALSYGGKNFPAGFRVNWSYSLDAGNTYRPLNTNSVSGSGVAIVTYTWIIPADAFGDNCLLRVAQFDNADQYVVSPAFSIIPQISMVTGTNRNETIGVPAQVKLLFNSNTSLLNDANLRVLVSDDNKTYTKFGVVTPVCAQGTVTLLAPTDWAGTRKYFRIETGDLVSKGFPRELAATTANGVQFVGFSTGARGNADGQVFTRLDLFADPDFTRVLGNFGGALGIGWITYGDTIYMRFALQDGAVTLTPEDVRFQFQMTEGANTWITMENVGVVDLELNQYAWTIPPRTYSGSINFRVIQVNTPVVPAPNAVVTDLNISPYIHVPDGGVQNNGNTSFQITIYSPALAVSKDALDNWVAEYKTPSGTVLTAGPDVTYNITNVYNNTATGQSSSSSVDLQWRSITQSGSSIFFTVFNLIDMAKITQLRLGHGIKPNTVYTDWLTIPH